VERAQGQSEWPSCLVCGTAREGSVAGAGKKAMRPRRGRRGRIHWATAGTHSFLSARPPVASSFPELEDSTPVAPPASLIPGLPTASHPIFAQDF
jgi:hypothetical protein